MLQRRESIEKWKRSERSQDEGIYTHHNYGDHFDGAFPALYTWLRHEGNTMQQARNIAIELLRDHLVTRPIPEEENNLRGVVRSSFPKKASGNFPRSFNFDFAFPW